MPFLRPTLDQLISTAIADMAGELGLFALLRFSPELAQAVVLAGLVNGCYGYLDYIANQATPFTAEDEALEGWASLIGVERLPATAASGTVTLQGVEGTPLPVGTLFARSDGARYRATAGGAVTGGSVTVPILAVDPGQTGNGLAGTQLSLDTAIVGISASSGSTSLLAGGADLEEPGSYRTRMLEAFAAPPQGGAATDYVRWAKEVPGVTRAWALPNGAGGGTVVVHTMFDDVRASFGGLPQGVDGGAAAETRTTPATGDQLLVADHIFPLRPATALVIAAAPVPYLIYPTIADLNDASLRPAIIASLMAFFRTEAEPGGTTYPSDLWAAIKAVPGVTRFSLPVPAAPVVAPTGQLPQLGTPIWA